MLFIKSRDDKVGNSVKVSECLLFTNQAINSDLTFV